MVWKDDGLYNGLHGGNQMAYKEKVCETIGKAKMIIMEWYQMRLVIFRDVLNSLCDKYNFPKKRLLIEQEVERI